MRQLKGKVKENARERKERKKEFMENKENAFRQRWTRCLKDIKNKISFNSAPPFLECNECCTLGWQIESRLYIKELNLIHPFIHELTYYLVILASLLWLYSDRWSLSADLMIFFTVFVLIIVKSFCSSIS